MARHPIKEREDTEEVPTPSERAPAQTSLVEREINLSLINDKINYIIGVVNEIAKACEITPEK